MKGWLSVVVGALLLLAGVLWGLQGLNVLGGSNVMSGKSMWAVIGLLVALVGLALLVFGARSVRRGGARTP